MKIYIAASAAEIERARAMRRELLALGFDVVSTWIENVDKVGASNPRDATREQRSTWAKQDLMEVMSAEVIWFLVPDVKAPTRGGWVELGFAYGITRFRLALEQPPIEMIFSGDTKQSIFTALGIEIETDEQALAFLREYREQAASRS